MPLNYSKWDNLEVSDDSDIEGHPNVDHKSLVRWKQRDIHEKRELRNARIEALKAEIACNKVLLSKMQSFHQSLSSPSPDDPSSSIPIPKRFSNEVERLGTNPSPEAPPTNAQQPVPYDTMLLKLYETIAGEAKQAGGDEEKLTESLLERLKHHIGQLSQEIEKRQKELDDELKEKNKKITSDDIHEGWESKYSPAKPEPEPLVKPSKKKAETKKTTEIEVLNPSAPSSSTPPAPSASTTQSSEYDDVEDELPHMTPSLIEFSKIPLWQFEKSWEFIQNHRDVVVPGAADALLVEAFNAQSEGKGRYSKQCVHQSLLLQYGEKLGKDGVKLFFQRMIAGGQKVHAIFRKDVEDTYNHIVQRVAITKAEEEAAGQQEQIQLVAENPDTEISFNVPDGPPPEHITLEGPGTEDLDVEEVRKVLQARWEAFSGLSEEMQEALKKGELAGVNEVLGKMPVDMAEGVVGILDMAGILSFAESGVKDETGKGEQVEA